MEENNNYPFNVVKNRAIPTYLLVNTREEGWCLSTAVQTETDKAQGLWSTIISWVSRMKQVFQNTVCDHVIKH